MFWAINPLGQKKCATGRSLFRLHFESIWGAASRVKSMETSAKKMILPLLYSCRENIGKKTLAVDLASILNARPHKDMFDNQDIIDISSSKERSRILNGNHSDIKIIDKEFSHQTNKSSSVISIDQIKNAVYN